MLPMIAHQQARSAEHRAAQRRAWEHAQRCASLPPLTKSEAERLVSEYLATHQPKVGPAPTTFGFGNNLSCGWGSR